MIEQKGENLVNRFGINHMVVVKDKDEWIWNSGDAIEQDGQNRCGRRWLRGLEHHPFANDWRNCLQRGDEVRKEPGGIIISFVQR
ncbi:MAG: hypothetical protein ABI645_13570 [Pseudomonadota bacterium]